ncbi:MAG: DUF4338 domain-containing protein [Chloroflexi bacterium]|nr:MAG: DUF4338 domain-containing protein [Chloroflexota bacterium]
MRVAENSWRFCGRDFTAAELAWIRALLADGKLNRSQLARRLCEYLPWVNGAGQLKAMSCRVAMLRMERAGLIRLPEPRHRNSNVRRPGLHRKDWPLPPLSAPRLASARGLRLELVQTAQAKAWYRALMEQHHYLGYTPSAGAQLRYLIWAEDFLAGGLGFGAAAWSIASRDRWIGWTAAQRQRQLHLLVNNHRFLLLPWLRIPNAGSCVLGRVGRQLTQDWEKRYGYRPVLLESFVEQERFSGRSYQTANWICVGQTQGRGKLEKQHSRVVPVKSVFLYPLTADFGDVLCTNP